MRYSPKTALKAIQRIYDLDFQYINKLTKLMGDEENTEKIKQIPEIKAFFQKNPQFIKTWEQLIGELYTYGKHAGAVLTLPYDIENIAPTLKNQIQISQIYEEIDNSQVYTLSLKDLTSDVRDKFANEIFKDDIKKLDKLMHDIYPEYKELFEYFNSNGITPDYDYRRLMGAMASPILREKILERGRDAYDEVSKGLKNARHAGMFVSNSGISSLIGDNIKNALNQLYETGNPKIIFELLSDIQFLSNNDMPIDRNTYENIFYKILEKYKSGNIHFEEEEKKLFVELGYWLNFSMSDI